MTKSAPHPRMTFLTASDNEVHIDVEKVSTITMSRADEQHCLIAVMYKNGQGERNFRLKSEAAQEMQQWLNAHNATLQADHTSGISVWIAKAQESLNTGGMIDALIGGRSAGDTEIEHRMMQLFATARDVRFSDEFITDFVPVLRLMIAAIARGVVIEELKRFDASKRKLVEEALGALRDMKEDKTQGFALHEKGKEPRTFTLDPARHPDGLNDPHSIAVAAAREALIAVVTGENPIRHALQQMRGKYDSATDPEECDQWEHEIAAWNNTVAQAAAALAVLK